MKLILLNLKILWKYLTTPNILPVALQGKFKGYYNPQSIDMWKYKKIIKQDYPERTNGTILSEEIRTECNKMTKDARSIAMGEAMHIIYKPSQSNKIINGTYTIPYYKIKK